MGIFAFSDQNSPIILYQRKDFFIEFWIATMSRWRLKSKEMRRTIKSYWLPPKDSYKKEEHYRLYLGAGLDSSTGKSLSKGILYRFTVEWIKSSLPVGKYKYSTGRGLFYHQIERLCGIYHFSWLFTIVVCWLQIIGGVVMSHINKRRMTKRWLPLEVLLDKE